MDRGWFTRIIQVAAVTFTLAAVLQELEKPKEQRDWHGKVGSIVPYEFRMPTIERLKESYWNPRERQVFTSPVFGVGWAINFCALLENLRVIEEDVSEESFLMPSQTIKNLLKNPPTPE